jgi:hypothetical protein
MPKPKSQAELLAKGAASPAPAAPVVQHYLLALYTLQDVARLSGQGIRPSLDWIKQHGIVAGIVGANRRNVLRLARYTNCIACEAELADDSSGDHMMPLAAGGPAGAENFLPLCGHCNSSKGTRDLLDWWRMKGRRVGELPPDVLCAYARLSFQQHRRLGTLCKPAPSTLAQAVDELVGALLDPEQEWMLRQRVSWITGRRW